MLVEKYAQHRDRETEPEPDNHRCILLHHGDPFTKLGPFKVEIAYTSPFIMIIHSLFTEEDMDYLVEYSKPRLSRRRQIDRPEDDGWSRPKNEWKTRNTVGLDIRLQLRHIIYILSRVI